MERWILYAILSMIFAGFTSVIAKMGLQGITGEVGLFVRTVWVFGLVLGFAFFWVPFLELQKLTSQNILWLGLSGVTTTLSWIFYYKAIKMGEVSTVALIDKGSFIIAVILAWLLLGEKITPRIFLGSILILTGLLVVARK
jgi:bacterial/archaeal transporter family protein